MPKTEDDGIVIKKNTRDHGRGRWTEEEEDGEEGGGTRRTGEGKKGKKTKF
jgi:hypothetical protein